MEGILDKLSSYNLFNYLLPGILFSAIGDRFTSFEILQDEIIVGLFVYYFIGLVVSRVGSLVLEPIFKRLGFLKFAKYEDFVSASQKDQKLDTLSEINNMYRTLFSTFFCLIVMLIADRLSAYYSGLSESIGWFLLIGLGVLFALAWWKQTNYITKRVVHYREKSKNE